MEIVKNSQREGYIVALFLYRSGYSITLDKNELS